MKIYKWTPLDATCASSYHFILFYSLTKGG